MSAPAKNATKPQMNDLKTLAGGELIKRYGVGVENYDRRIFELSDEQFDQTFDAAEGVGEWSPRVLLGHCADAELAFVHRMRRVVAEEGPVFSVWDENAFIERGLYGKPGATVKHTAGGFVAAVHTMRVWTREWLGGLSEGDFARTAMHPQRGPMTTRDVLVYATHHLEHHAWFLNRKVEMLLGHGAKLPIIGQ